MSILLNLSLKKIRIIVAFENEGLLACEVFVWTIQDSKVLYGVCIYVLFQHRDIDTEKDDMLREERRYNAVRTGVKYANIFTPCKHNMQTLRTVKLGRLSYADLSGGRTQLFDIYVQDIKSN